MAKELPFFRFTATEWLNGDINMEPKNIKGVFADVCAYYWFKDCSITQALLKKRFSNDQEELKALFKSNIIKEKNDSDFIEISFLDEQYDLLSESRKRRQEAGRKGGKKKPSKAKAKLKQSSSYKDKDKDKYKDKDIYRKFDHLKITNEEYKKLTDEYGRDIVDNKIDYLENSNNNKKYKTIYRTVLNWLKADKSKQPKKEDWNWSDEQKNVRH